MRTTIDLPDELFRDLKMAAIQRRTSLKEIVRTAVEHELAGAGQSASGHRVEFPLLKSKEPEVLSLTNAEIEDLLT